MIPNYDFSNDWLDELAKLIEVAKTCEMKLMSYEEKVRFACEAPAGCNARLGDFWIRIPERFRLRT